MSNGANLTALAKTLTGLGKEHVKVQTYWAKAKSIDWDAKTMVATAVIDGLDFFDVDLGIGSCYRKPKVGTMCLLGLIENMDGATFLLDAAEVEETVHTSGKTELTIKEQGFILKQDNESFKPLLNDFENQVVKLCDELAKVVVLMGTGPNVAAIAAIKTAILDDIKVRTNKIFIA